MMKQYNSIGGVGLFARPDKSGHAYYLDNHDQSVKFIDHENDAGVSEDELLTEKYQKGNFLIPINFSEQSKELLTQRIIANPHPNDAFSLTFIIKQIWDKLSLDQKYGTNTNFEVPDPYGKQVEINYSKMNAKQVGIGGLQNNTGTVEAHTLQQKAEQLPMAGGG